MCQLCLLQCSSQSSWICAFPPTHSYLYPLLINHLIPEWVFLHKSINYHQNKYISDTKICSAICHKNIQYAFIFRILHVLISQDIPLESYGKEPTRKVPHITQESKNGNLFWVIYNGFWHRFWQAIIQFQHLKPSCPTEGNKHRKPYKNCSPIRNLTKIKTHDHKVGGYFPLRHSLVENRTTAEGRMK